MHADSFQRKVKERSETVSILKRVLSRLLRISSRRKDIDESVAEGLLKGFEWVDGEEAEAEEEPMPMFRAGEDEVVLYNPYEGEFMSMDFLSFEPERYRVIDVDYDADDKVFRYRLDDGTGDLDDVWYSEDWLSLPTVSRFVTKKVDVERDLVVRKGMIEDAIIGRSLEEDLREREIDRFLDLLRTGNAEERKAAEKELRKLSGGVAE